MPQAGGEPARVTRIDGSAGELMHAYPYALPDGRHILLLISTGSPEQTGIYRVSLDGKGEEAARPISRAAASTYAPPLEGQTLGHLLVMRQDTLMALPVNPKTIEPAGDPFRWPAAWEILSRRRSSPSHQAACWLTASAADAAQIDWFDRSGNALSTVGASGDYIDVALSRDGTRAAVSQYD